MVGLGLDYDIFLLTRIYECRLAGMTDVDSISDGLISSGSVITAAGMIMAVAFAGANPTACAESRCVRGALRARRACAQSARRALYWNSALCPRHARHARPALRALCVVRHAATSRSELSRPPRASVGLLLPTTVAFNQLATMLILSVLLDTFVVRAWSSRSERLDKTPYIYDAGITT